MENSDFASGREEHQFVDLQRGYEAPLQIDMTFSLQILSVQLVKQG